MILLRQMLRSCDSSAKCRCPHCEWAVIADRVADHLWELACVCLTVLGEHCVAADLAGEIEFGFAMLWDMLANAQSVIDR